MIGFGALAVTAGASYAVWAPRPAPGDWGELTPPEVLAGVEAGDLMLVDIRRPDEWRRTGIAPGAIPLDMRRKDFAEALAAARGDSALPVVLICAGGVRSRRLTARLTKAGIGPLIDVPEGMVGSSAGPGWIERGLPTETWTN